MSDFRSVVKHLDIVRARKASAAELTASGPNFTNPTKYLELKDSRHIKKVHTNLIVPGCFYNNLQVSVYPNPILMRQYNFSFSAPFYILSNQFIDPAVVPEGELCVKWRVGQQVFRYKFTDYSDAAIAPLYAPQY